MSDTTTLRALTSTGKDDWRTPRAVLDDLDREFAFGLDAAASTGAEAFPGRPYLGPGSPWGEDALAPDGWKAAIGGGPATVWLNPPYSKAAGGGAGILAWHRRAWEESRHGLTVVVLCPPHPGRGWFWKWTRRAGMGGRRGRSGVGSRCHRPGRGPSTPESGREPALRVRLRLPVPC